MIPFSHSPPALASPDNSSMFKGLNYHIQTAGVDHFKMWNVRQKLEAGGATYIKDPENPSCHVIFVFSPLIDRHLYHPSDSAKPLEICRQESSWTFDDYCTHLGRKEGDKTKRSNFVVSATWVNHCIKEGRQCRDGRWALHEVIVRGNKPLQVKVGHSIPRSSKSGSPLTPMSLCTPSPRPSLDRLAFGDIFTTTTIKPAQPIIEKPKLLDPFTKAPPPAKTFHILECINKPNLEDSIILRGGLIESADLADYILVDQSDTNTPLGSLKLVGKQQVLSFQWLRDSIACGEIQDFAAYKIEPLAGPNSAPRTKPITEEIPEVDIRPSSLPSMQKSSTTSTTKQQVERYRPTFLSEVAKNEPGSFSSPASPGRSVAKGKAAEVHVAQAKLNLVSVPTIDQRSSNPGRNRHSTHLGKSTSTPALGGDIKLPRGPGHIIHPKDYEMYRQEVIAALDKWFKKGLPGTRTAVLDALTKRNNGHDRAGFFRRHRKEISLALSNMGHDVGIGGKLNGHFFHEEWVDRSLDSYNLPAYLQRSPTFVALENKARADHTNTARTSPHHPSTAGSAGPVLPSSLAIPVTDQQDQDQGSESDTDMNVDIDSEADDPSFAIQDDTCEDDPTAMSMRPSIEATRGRRTDHLRDRAMVVTNTLLARIVDELDQWCQKGCPGNRTPYLKALDAKKRDYCRTTFFSRHRMRILKALSDMGHDAGEGTRLNGWGPQGSQAEQRIARRNGLSSRQAEYNRRNLMATSEDPDAVPRIGTQKNADSDEDDDLSDLSEEDDNVDLDDSTSAEDGYHRSHQHNVGRAAQSDRMVKQIIKDLDGWCKDGCPGVRTRFLQKVNNDNPGPHRVPYFTRYRVEILQALSEMGHDISPGTKLHGQSYQSVLADKRHSKMQASRSADIEQTSSSAPRVAASHSSGPSRITLTSGPAASQSIPSTSLVPPPPHTPTIADSLFLRNPTWLNGPGWPPISKALCDF